MTVRKSDRQLSQLSRGKGILERLGSARIFHKSNFQGQKRGKISFLKKIRADPSRSIIFCELGDLQI